MTDEVKNALTADLALKLSMAQAITRLLLEDARQRAEPTEAGNWSSIQFYIERIETLLPPF